MDARLRAMNLSSFSYCMPTRVVFGAGSTKHAVTEIAGDSVLIISDPFLYQNGAAEAIGSNLTGKHVAYFSDIQPNPTTTSVDAGAELARNVKATTIIGLGGGSAMDVAKVVSCLVSNPGSIYDYYGGGTQKFEPRTAKLILIPTTAGTGSEVTNVGVFTNVRTHLKLPFVCQEFWADTALIDPELTYSMPPAVTASTGMDAFCHAIEAYWNIESQPMCDFLAMGAMKLILENILTAYNEPNNAKARSAMIVASLTAGVAFSQTRTTAIHAISFPLTVDHKASHGMACAVTLPLFIRLCEEQAGDKMRDLAKFLGYDSVPALADAVESLMTQMKQPVRLSQLPVPVVEDDLPKIAHYAVCDAAGQMHLTPVNNIMDEAAVVTMLRGIL